jgi:hypothetical protein
MKLKARRIYLNDEQRARVMTIKIFSELDRETLLELAAVLALPSPNDVSQRIALLVLVQNDVTLTRIEMTKFLLRHFNLA